MIKARLFIELNKYKVVYRMAATQGNNLLRKSKTSKVQHHSITLQRFIKRKEIIRVICQTCKNNELYLKSHGDN